MLRIREGMTLKLLRLKGNVGKWVNCNLFTGNGYYYWIVRFILLFERTRTFNLSKLSDKVNLYRPILVISNVQKDFETEARKFRGLPIIKLEAVTVSLNHNHLTHCAPFLTPTGAPLLTSSSTFIAINTNYYLVSTVLSLITTWCSPPPELFLFM